MTPTEQLRVALNTLATVIPEAEAALAKIRPSVADLNAELADLHRQMDAVSKRLKPNWSNDMPWCDEIIICYENVKQHADEVTNELTAMTSVANRRRELLRELFYLRVPSGMKLQDMLIELGHHGLWQRIFAEIDPRIVSPEAPP